MDPVHCFPVAAEPVPPVAVCVQTEADDADVAQLRDRYESQLGLAPATILETRFPPRAGRSAAVRAAEALAVPAGDALGRSVVVVAAAPVVAAAENVSCTRTVQGSS